MIHAIDKRSRNAIGASYALPDLLAAVREVVYNALDAGALSVRVFVDTVEGSFSVVDDGEGIAPHELSKLVGECIATSRALDDREASARSRGEFYGSKGETLHSLVSIAASVEIESRVPDQWMSHRKVFELGVVVLNACSKDVRPAAGTTVKVRQLFHLLPVRRKKLSQDAKYQTRISEDIKAMLVGTALLWPSVAFELKFQRSSRQAVVFPAVRSPRERICAVFGGPLGMELQEFSAGDDVLGSIHGYFALLPDEWGGASPGIKQARAFYQHVFFDRRWNGDAHETFGRTITQKCIELGAGIPIFVLNIIRGKAAIDAGYDRSIIDQVCSYVVKGVVKLVSEEDEKREPTNYSDKHFVDEWALTSQIPATSNYAHAGHHAIQVDETIKNTHSQQEMLEFSKRHGFEPREDSVEEMSADQMFEAYHMFEDEMATTQSVELGWPIEPLQHESCEDYEAAELYLDIPCYECGISSFTSELDAAEFIASSIRDSYSDESGLMVDKKDSSEVEWASTRDEVYPPDSPPICRVGSRKDREDIFFSTACSLQKVVRTHNQDETPWLSSYTSQSKLHGKSAQGTLDNVFDDVMYASVSFEPTTNTFNITNEEGEYAENMSVRTTVSGFFTSRSSRMSTRPRCARLIVKPMISFSDRMQVQALCAKAKQKTIKLNRTVLNNITFIRQVDRKFILASVMRSDGDSTTELLLCVDQHAADERVRLEKLEAEIFGRDGCGRNFDIKEHDPALIILLNRIERTVVEANEILLRGWGFDIQLCPQSQWSRFNDSRAIGDDSGGRYLLRTTPQIEKRVANADDFREFVQSLSMAPGKSTLSAMRPPVITRFLHSRACRSAIMFGDYLSIGQCKELLNELRLCQLPFQCAHGRPSVVPLAEFISDKNEK